MKTFKRLSAMVLAAALCLSLLCVSALADETETTVQLNQTSLTLAVGDTASLSATVSDGQGVTWQSLTTSVVSVDAQGKVTALAEGSATIRATTADGSASAICKIEVYMAFPSYSLREGESVTLQSTLSGNVTWSSNNSSIASVSSSGTVTAHDFGRTYIVASNGSETEGFSITVGGHVGIDISSWNGTIDWDALEEQGIEFVMIRAGYGWEHTDARFIENIEGAIAHGMPIGIYFYSYAESAEKAQVEADYCAELLEPYKEHITLPVAYDLEEYSSLTGTQLVEFAEIFCGTLQEAGFHTMVYANGSFFSKMDLSSLSDMGVDYWYAWYATVPNLNSIPTIRGTSSLPSIWQYSSSCVVQGALASGRTDINVLYMPEYLSFSAPVVTAENTSSGARIQWGGSTYASSYTVYRVDASGNTTEVGTYDGTVHSCTDQSFLPGMGYFVTMEISDPIDGTYYRSYTSEAVYPSAARYTVTVSAQEGGSASGGGSFIVGETATVQAAADEGYTFAGWYNAAGERVSSSAEYSFTVTASVALTAHFSAEEENVSNFTDVQTDDWYAEAVAYAVENGLFTGTSDTTFSPNGTMTRGMLVTVLYRQAGEPEASNHNKFVDVSADIWYARAVTWAYDNGIVNGTGDKTFSPEEPVTREQIATILMRYSDKMGMDVPETTSGDLSVFGDGDQVSSFALEGMRWAVAAQLINGNERNELNPQGNATRAECATILMRWSESGLEQ